MSHYGINIDHSRAPELPASDADILTVSIIQTGRPADGRYIIYRYERH